MSASSALAANGASEKHAIVVYNEKTKLLANALDRAATAILSLGVVAPIATDLYGGQKVAVESQVIWFVLWLTVGVLLHGVARLILGKLKHV